MSNLKIYAELTMPEQVAIGTSIKLELPRLKTAAEQDAYIKGVENTLLAIKSFNGAGNFRYNTLIDTLANRETLAHLESLEERPVVQS